MARILIADDDEQYVQVFSDGLSSLGHDVTGVQTGDVVVETIQAHKFDIVFLDVVMPGGGAVSVLHRIRSEDSELPVVIITGRPEMSDSPLFVSGLRMAQAKLSKTASLVELDGTVRMLTRK